MTPAKMFEGDLWVLASHAVQMAENAYKNGQTDEREACAKVCEELPAPDIYSDTDKSMWDVACMDCAAAIRERSANARARGQA